MAKVSYLSNTSGKSDPPQREVVGHDTYILNPLWEAVVTDIAFALILFRTIEPRDAFMEEPTEDFRADQVSDCRSSSGSEVRDTSRVA